MAGGLTTRLTVREERVGRVLLIIMGIGFAALIAAAVAIGWINGRNDDYAASIVHTQTVRQAVGDLQVALEQSETSRRGYLLGGAPSFRATYQRVSSTFEPRIARLRALTADNPRQLYRLDRIEEPLARLLALRTASIALIDAHKMDEAQRDFTTDPSVNLLRAVRARLGAMAGEEQSLLAARAARQRGAIRLFYGALIASGILLALVAIVSLLVVARNTATITASRNTLRSLNDNLEERVTDRTADLSRANEEIQRFAYIVSHDLRSPLVNVMGFTAELEAATGAITALVDRAEAEAPDIVTEEVRLAAREDLPEAIGFIRTSTQKMDRLINAILTLSRQGRRVLAPELLDLTAIVDTIRDTLAHRLEAQEATIEVDGTLPAITSDRFAIEQILSNLIENAVKYFQPGRPGRIVVSGVRDGQRATIEIADNGRGIAPADHQRVFDLFRRSGKQDQPGEGIGLAHVRALAYRLGGIVDVRSTLGEGATFRLLLPMTLNLQDTAA